MTENSGIEKQREGLTVNPLSAALISLALFLGIFIGIAIILVVQNFDDSSSNRSIDNAAEVPTISDDEYYDTEYIDSVLQYFEDEYIEELDDYSSEDITYGALKGIIESLDDEYTSFLTPEETEAYLTNRSPDFEGIGVTLSYDGEYTFIESVFPGFPAEGAGVVTGDIILEVDGESMVGKQPAEVASVVRGEKGTEVVLSVLRIAETRSEQLEIPITRDKIDIDNILWEQVDEETVLIRIIQFSDQDLQTFTDSWKKVVGEINSEVPGVEHVVVDLRGNPGGFVEGVKYVMEEFLPTDAILMQERQKGKPDVQFKDDRVGEFEDTEVVVIVNEGSASASEIFASGIAENDRGEVVGMPTVGKGVEQKVIPLSDGSTLFLVFQQWLTPDGNEIDSDNPITPDVEVDFTEEDRDAGVDPQEEKALELVRE